MSTRRIINLDELEFHEWSSGERFAGRMGEGQVDYREGED